MIFLSWVLSSLGALCVFWSVQSRTYKSAIMCVFGALGCAAVWIAAKVLFHVYGIPA